MVDDAPSLQVAFGRACRETRTRLRLTQRQLADRVGLSRGYIATIERLRANPTVEVIERVGRALDLDAKLVFRGPTIVGGPQGDLVHAQCSGYVERRLRSLGWLTVREAEIVHARSHGWIDCLALDPTTETLIVIEIKTRLDDLGAVERQLGWYARVAADTSRRFGWHPRRVVAWLLLLASAEVEASIQANRAMLEVAFPVRAREMLAWLGDRGAAPSGRGLALVDPASKRRAWLIRTRLEGRRSDLPYRGYIAAARRFKR